MTVKAGINGEELNKEISHNESLNVARREVGKHRTGRGWRRRKMETNKKEKERKKTQDRLRIRISMT